MNLVFLDADFNNLSNPVDDYTSLIWTENWHSTGRFNLLLPTDRFKIVHNAKYLYNQDTDSCAVINNLNYAADTKPTLSVGGQMLESILSTRVFEKEVIFDDTLNNAIYTALSNLTQTGDRKIDKLIISQNSAVTDVYDGMAEEGQRLDVWLYDTLTPLGLSYRIHYDYQNNELIFSVVAGVDRTQSQDDNAWAIFSSEFENISNIAYEMSSEKYYNFAYIIGEYNGSRIVETIDETNGNDRREILLKPSVTSDEAANVTQYRKVLKQKGVETLAEYAMSDTVTGDVDTSSSLKYGVNYNIGDLCDIVLPDLLDEPISERITSVDHVYEPTGYRIIPRFGKGLLNLKDYIKREMKY